jgi:nitrite reductase/ring-hydroxylating ferredoxin subunit
VTARRYVVAEVGEIPAGGHKLVTVAGREIGVFFVDGEYFALRHRCPHQGGPLCAGHLLRVLDAKLPGEYSVGPRRLLQCPWHGWEFDIRTGQSWFDPVRRVRRYPVTVEVGADVREGEPLEAVTIEPGPYQAETYPVSVDREYVIVEI